MSGLGLVLTLAGLGDIALALVPLRLGNAEWEFGTIAAVFAGLPLSTMGLSALLAGSVMRGRRRQTVIVAIVMLLLALFVLAGSIIFLLDVPIALAATQGGVRFGISKAIVKTLLLGVLFFAFYIVSAIAALRRPQSEA